MSKRELYPAYNGLARVAMVWGVPLMTALAIFCPVVIVSIVLAALLGPGGLLFLLVIVPVFIFIKQMCESDDQALSMLWLELKIVMLRRYTNLFGKSFTLAPIKYGRRLPVYRQVFRKEDGESSN
jgi:type IV secretion system protein VirB3